MDFTPTDLKKKDPDSFSIDPDNPDTNDNTDLSKRLPQLDVQSLNPGPILSPILGSPKLRRIDSFSQEDAKPAPSTEELSNLPLPMRMTLNICEAFNKELKTIKKMNSFIATMEENLKLTEQLVKRQEKRIDEFFNEVYDLFNKTFFKMAESHKQNMKNKLQQEFTDYRFTHDIIKSNLDYIMAHDSFAKVLQHELFNNTTQQTSTTPSNRPTTSAESENKSNFNQMYTQFVNSSLDFKFGLTPLAKKFKLIQYSLQQHHEKPVLSQNISPNISEIKKEPLKEFINMNAELENFVNKLSANFSHEISSISHPHSQFMYTIDKIAKTSPIILPFDASGKSSNQIDTEESAAVRKRLSLVEIDTKGDDASDKEKEGGESEKEKEKDTSREPKSPQLSGRSTELTKTPTSLTPVKSVTYKVPVKENNFTANTGWFNNSGEAEEISYQTQLISVHHNLSVGDLISVSGIPYRILHKEWIFPEDIVQMENIFTGERLEVKYNSRYTGMEDQIITKKYQVIKIGDKKGYYLLMDMVWDKMDTCKKLPKVIEAKDVLDKKLEDDIKETFYSDKKVLVHTLKVKDKEVIVSYRREWQ